MADDLLKRRQTLSALKTALWSERSSFDSHWRELGDYLLPRRMRFWASDRNKGDRRNQNIIDSTARFASRTLQSGLHAGLTSPARPWFVLTTPDPDLAEQQDVKTWLHTVTARMQTVFASTNLYNALPIVYGDMSVFGTAAMGVLTDSEALFRCYPYPIGSYALGLDERGLATTFIRDYELTVRQVVRQFGVKTNGRDIDWTRISTTVKNLWDQGQYETAIPLTWVVVPNDDHDPNRLESRFKRWSSVHFEAGDGTGQLMRDSGFDTFPILAPRWDITGEDTYGTDCPGMTALGDVKALQILQREKAKAIKKSIDPPLLGTPELRTQKTSLLPGDITFVSEPQHGLRPIHEISLNLNHVLEDIQETQSRIRRAFYEDLFLMLANDLGAERPTAREVQERHEEKLLALGPVLERTNDELLDPLIDRVYGMMEATNLLPPPPERLQGVNLRVEYISIMAQAQKLVGVVGQDRFVASLAPLMADFPGVADKIDVFQLVDNYSQMLGIDPRIVRPTADAQALGQARAQQAQQQAALSQAALVARTAKDAAAAPVGGNTVLDQVLSGGAMGAAQGA